MTLAPRDAQLCSLWIKALWGPHCVTFHHLSVLTGLLPPSLSRGGSPNSKRFVFCDICYLLLAHCFGGGGVMLKFLGAVDHALFDTITHFFHGECHRQGDLGKLQSTELQRIRQD